MRFFLFLFQCVFLMHAALGRGIDQRGMLSDEALPQDAWKHYYLYPIAGLFTGHAVRNGEVNATAQLGRYSNALPAHYVHALCDHGLFWGGMIGVQGIFNQRWVGGLEFDVMQYDIEHTHEIAFSDPAMHIGTAAEVTYRQKWVVDGSARLGFAVRPYFVPFVRAGVVVSRDHFDTLFKAPALPLPDVMVQDERWVYRFLSGLGFEIPLACYNVSFRFEYLYFSKGKTIETSGAYTDGVLNPIYTSAQQPFVKSGRLSLVWNFTQSHLFR